MVTELPRGVLDGQILRVRECVCSWALGNLQRDNDIEEMTFLYIVIIKKLLKK